MKTVRLLVCLNLQSKPNQTCYLVVAAEFLVFTPTTSRDCLSINQDYRPSTAELLKLPTVRLTLARETQITKALKVQMKY
jgi:hypothetical protein